MDLLITAAMASLNLPLLEEAWLPVTVLALAGLLRQRRIAPGPEPAASVLGGGASGAVE